MMDVTAKRPEIDVHHLEWALVAGAPRGRGAGDGASSEQLGGCGRGVDAMKSPRWDVVAILTRTAMVGNLFRVGVAPLMRATVPTGMGRCCTLAGVQRPERPDLGQADGPSARRVCLAEDWPARHAAADRQHE